MSLGKIAGSKEGFTKLHELCWQRDDGQQLDTWAREA